MSGKPHALVALPPGMELRVPIKEDGGWTPETVWTFRSQEKSIVRAGDGTADRPTHSLVLTSRGPISFSRGTLFHGVSELVS